MKSQTIHNLLLLIKIKQDNFQQVLSKGQQGSFSAALSALDRDTHILSIDAEIEQKLHDLHPPSDPSLPFL